ncbi:MAG: CotH kinase family protein [Bacteroidales bacterium]
MKKLLPILLILNLVNPTFSQVVINEICSRNATIIYDEDGDNEDWIELYNTGTSPINLNGYFISDDNLNYQKWQFPNVTIQPYSFLTLFASGKDRKKTIDHWETAVYAEDQWRGIIPDSTTDTLWREPPFNDAGWILGNGGFGYGDGDDQTVVTPPVSSIYIRKTFNIVDTSEIGSAILNVDYDDAFVAYLNGIEIARKNIGEPGFHPVYNELAYQEHEALMYQGMLPEKFFIPEEYLKLFIHNGPNVLAIEVHNISESSSDMTLIPYLHFAIKDNSNNYGTPPSWFEMGVSRLHINFKLAAEGETLYLLDAFSNLIDQKTYPYTQLDNSSGRQPDGNTNWVLFGIPTPDASNNTSTSYTQYVTDPVFSLNAGYYNVPQSLSISCSFPASNIRYTIDGSNPTQTSSLYTTAVSIDSTMVIKARAFATTALPSHIITNTYFINDSSTLCVVSISTQPDKLWDWNSGIYVLGPNAEPETPNFNANFWQDWEIPAQIEFFLPNGNIEFEQDVGMRIGGNYSRSFPQKSFKIYARDKYGDPDIDYKLFPDKNIQNYKRFILRNSGTDWNNTHFKDAFTHKSVQKNTHIDIQDYRPSLVYLNGQYWGVLNMREKINKFYLEENYGVNPDSVDLLAYEGSVVEGSNENFINMAYFIIHNDMADSANYEIAKGWLDVENFYDYFITEIYYNNWDWPQNNIKYWREQKPDAKWRYILWDIDNGLSQYFFNDLNRILTMTDNAHTLMLTKLLKNNSAKNYFINRYADLINTCFYPDNLRDLAFMMRDSIASEMPRHFAKWGDGTSYPDYSNMEGWGNFDNWYNWNIGQSLIDFVSFRPEFVRNHIENQFSLNKQVVVTLKVEPADAGRIKINTIIPDSLPWAGIYFDGNPITLTAIPKPGYEFAFWNSVLILQNPDYNQTITLNPDTNDVFTAYFFGSPDTPRITFSEINYNSASYPDAGDWIELYNYGNIPFDLSCWSFKDGNDNNCFNFPDNTILNSGAYLVLYRDSVKFAFAFPSVTNKIGALDFGLSVTGDSLRLYDTLGKLYLSMSYSPSAPWPAEANGLGYTLELLDNYGNLNNAYNWFAGCIGGSPGGPFTPCDNDITELSSDGLINFDVFPNPFINSTNIAFSIDEASWVSIKITDIYGKAIETLLAQEMQKGNYKINFSAENISPGIYLCQLRTSKHLKTKLLQVVK